MPVPNAASESDADIFKFAKEFDPASAIRELQNKALRNRIYLVDFKAYACSMGFLARTIFEERLAAFLSQ